MEPDYANTLRAMGVPPNMGGDLPLYHGDSGKQTLRDEFAIAALRSLSVSGVSAADIAEQCYRVADAMMEARKK